MSFDQYTSLFYRWLDEMRTDMKLHSIEMEKHAINMERLDDNQALLVRLLRNMGDKLDDHEGRLNQAGI
jgi:hypothetical protein